MILNVGKAKLIISAVVLLLCRITLNGDPMVRDGVSHLFTTNGPKNPLVLRSSQSISKDLSDEYITIAILAKDMAHTLPLYLSCIEKQTWPKNKTYLYVRTNNNNDNTGDILKNWINKVKKAYADIYFDDTNVPEQVQKYQLHEWNSERFKVLGAIRQASVDWAQKKNSHYFVADCDNFIKPHTIETLLNTNRPVIAPLLRRGTGTSYTDHSTFYTLDPNDPDFFNTSTPLHKKLIARNISDITQVPIAHSTYLIRKDVLKDVIYDDKSGRWEFIIFSDTMNKKNIPQYIDTREVYGYLTRAENARDFSWWLRRISDDTWLANIGSEQQQKPYLWVYWKNKDNAPTPGYISLCRRSLLKHCSQSFTIVELDDQNIYEYLSELKEKEHMFNLHTLKIAQQVDYYRVLLLHKFGGLYIDADILVMRDLKEITDKLNAYDYVGFGDYKKSKRSRYGTPENWVMASRPHGIFISELLKNMEERLAAKDKIHYHDLGKNLLKKVLKPMIEKQDYRYYHYDNSMDGTKEKSGEFVMMDKMFSSDEIIYKDPHKQLFIALYGSAMDPDLKILTEEELLSADTNFSRFTKISLEI